MIVEKCLDHSKSQPSKSKDLDNSIIGSLKEHKTIDNIPKPTDKQPTQQINGHKSAEKQLNNGAIKDLKENDKVLTNVLNGTPYLNGISNSLSSSRRTLTIKLSQEIHEYIKEISAAVSEQV